MRPIRPGCDVQKLELSDKDWQRYVGRVRDAASPAPLELRAGRRHRKIVQCVLRVEHAGDAHIFVIHSRDIGDGGMSFMHDAPLPASAPCTVVLETNGGRGYVVHGRVRWTREVGGGLHAIGIGFDESLDLREFIDVAERIEGASAA